MATYAAGNIAAAGVKGWQPVRLAEFSEKNTEQTRLHRGSRCGKVRMDGGPVLLLTGKEVPTI